MREELKPVIFRHVDGSLVVSAESTTRIITLEQLLEVAGLDGPEWEVTHVKPNSWEMAAKTPDGDIIVTPLYQIKATLVPNKEFVRSQEIVTIFRETLREVYVPLKDYFYPTTFPVDEQVAVELDIMDIHFGILASGEETGDIDVDIAVTEALFLGAVERLIERVSSYNISRWIFPIGNDIIHAEARTKSTTKGTLQDVDPRYMVVWRRTYRTVVKAIERLRMIAPVDVIIVPGNHAYVSEQFLGEALSIKYEGLQGVSVDCGLSPRKYHLYGENLLGFTHGSEERVHELPGIMANEANELGYWHQSSFRAWRIGHLHKKKVIETSVTEGGVSITTLPSLVPPDSWHAGKGYGGYGCAAEACVWSRFGGPIGSARVNRKVGSTKLW